jgi:hypothetical protein
MPASPAQLLHEWHDFYILLGTASATLVGLMFVAVSIGASVFDEGHRAPMKAFITPTVMHFAAVLFACVVVTIPSHSWWTLGGLIATGGLPGAIYCGRILVDIIIRHSFNAVDVAFRRGPQCLGHDVVIKAPSGGGPPP